MTGSRIHKLVLMGIFAALAYVVMYLIRIPVFGFLTLDPKDAVIGIAAFILGPAPALLIAFVVAVLEMPISGTGVIGLGMNLASTIAFVGTATLIYRRKPSWRSALIGLLAGTAVATALMLLLNYLLTPLYMGVPRADVAALLVPVLLPFNLSKAAINGALIMGLYLPVMRALSAVGFIRDESSASPDLTHPRNDLS